jgi:hypothetical protein
VFSIDKEEKNNSGYLEFKSEFNKSNNGTISKILETEKPLEKSKKKIKIIIIFSKNFIFTIYLEII